MKRLISILIITILLLLPCHAIAENSGPLSYERSVALMNLNNNTLKKLERAESDAYRQYKSNLDQANTMDIKGFTFEFGNTEEFIAYDPDTKVMMRKIKELYPEQMKFAWESAGNNRKVTENTLRASLRGVFFGVYNTQEDLNLKQKQLDLAAELNKQDVLKRKKGLITELDLQESGFNLEKAKKAVDTSKRNFDNAVRNFNQFVGTSSRTRYTTIIFEDVLKHPAWNPVEYYTEKALDNRVEIISIRKQIALKEQERELIESGYAYKTSTTEQDEYERLLNDIEQQNMDMESIKLTITNEINNAYVDVINAGKKVNSIKNTLNIQNDSHTKMKERYKAGMITRSALTQSELGLLQLENSYKAAMFDYNTRILRFNNATGIGPEY